ncbi:condensation domain-containing protein [Burkholderia contaminans]|uniref:condensation domain-containing protein n=1 Tax=Burkholderia contaminans TaxID=488447 RepID=UPI0021B427DC|nr:condensation domain-containing protein [Burkholderia contaminans]
MWQQSHAAPPLAIPLGVTSLADAAPAARQAAMLATATGMQESFTLSAPPLLRAHLFQFGPDAPQRLLVVAHHLVIDGVSWRILFEDLYAACRQLEAGHAVQLPARTTAWRDWSTRLSGLGATALDGLGLDYWLQGNAGEPACFDDMPAGTVAEAGSTIVEFDAQQTLALLQDVPRAFNTQINEVLLTALLLAFGDWTGNASLVVDLEGHGREDVFDGVDTSRTIGWFTTHYPVCLNAGDATVAVDALRHVKEQLRAVPMRGARLRHRPLPRPRRRHRGGARTGSRRRRCASTISARSIACWPTTRAGSRCSTSRAPSTARAHVAATCSRSTGWCSTAVCA